MKTIQITMDEKLLSELDRHEETQRDGRSAVLRRAAEEYLKRRRHQGIADGYKRAYGKKAGLGREFEGWANEGAWPID